MPRLSRLFVVVLVVIEACHYAMRVDPVDVGMETLRLGEADFAEILHALERVELAGEASLKAGTFAIASDGYEAMEVQPGTRLRFDAQVGIASVDARAGDEALRVIPDVERFELRFSKPVVLHGRNSAARVTLSGARLAEGSGDVEVGVRVGRSLVGSLAAAVAGVPAGGDMPQMLDMVARVEVPQLRATFRRSSVLVHGRSELYMRDASTLTLSDVDWHPEAGTARLDVAGELLLGQGTCLELVDVRLCTNEAVLRVRGDYQRGSDGTERMRMSVLDSPTHMEIGPGQVSMGDHQLAIERVRVQLDRYECAGAFGDESVRCAYELSGEALTGEGQTLLEGMPLAFDSLRLDGLQVRSIDGPEGASESVRVGRLRMANPRIRVSEQIDAQLAGLRLEGLQGTRLGSLGFGASDVVAEEGVVRAAVGDVALEIALGGETRIHLSEREVINLGDEVDEAAFGIQTEVESIHVRHRDAVLVEARGVHLDAKMSPRETRAELRLAEALRVDPSALVDVAIADVRLRLRALRLVYGDGGFQLTTDGLELALPQEQVLAVLRPQIPPTFIGDESPVSSTVEGALAASGRLVGGGGLSRFRTRLEASGLDALELGFERGRLRVRGDVDATMRLLADEHRVEVVMCEHTFERTMSVPCFEGGMPGLCERQVRVAVPHPCVESEDVDTEVVAGTLRISIDVSGQVRTNAPARLSDLTLTAGVARCDRIEVEGIPASLQRAADVREVVCDQLKSHSRTVRLAEVLDIGAHPLLGQASVQRFDMQSDAEDLRIGLDIDVRLGEPAPRSSAQ